MRDPTTQNYYRRFISNLFTRFFIAQMGSQSIQIFILLMYNSQQTPNHTTNIHFTPTDHTQSPYIQSENYNLQRASQDSHILALKDILTNFRTQITTFLPNLSQQPLTKDKIQKRLVLLQSQIDGLLRKKSSYTVSTKDGVRQLDYTALLLEKENQIINMQRKINAYEGQASTSKGSLAQTPSDLRLKIAKLTAELANRDDIIKAKNQFIISQFGHYAETRDYFLRVKNTFDRTYNKGELTNLFEGVQLPPSVDRDYRIHDLSSNNIKPRKILQGENKIKAEIEALVAELQNIKVYTEDQFQETVKNFFSGIEGSKLSNLFRISEQYQLLSNRFRAASSIWSSQLKDIKRQYPSARIQIDKDITKLLQDSRIDVIIINDVVQLQPNPVVQIPMSESRTSQLLQLVSVQLRGLLAKYPKLEIDIDKNVIEFFNEGVVDTLTIGGDINKIVEIVKYVPQEVRVDNVYSFRSDKHSRVQYHLRVLVKALLEELERIRVKTNQVLELDESVLTMIREEILDIVNVDDILKVFKVNTKIVEVQKVIEKIVERVVQVPQIVPIEKIVEKIIQVPKIQQIQKVVHVPVEIVKFVDNVVEKIVEVEKVIEVVKEVPKLIERIVQKIIQVPKIVEVQKIVEKVVVETNVVEIEKLVQKPTIEIRQVEILKEVLVPVETVVERTVQVPVYVEKIIERVVNVPQIIEVEKIVQKVVRDTEYKVVQQNNVQVEVAVEIVDRVVQKIVIVDNYIQKILEVPKVIQKIVAIREQSIQVKQVEVIREKIVPVYQVKQIEKVVNTVTPLIQEVEKIIDRKVEVPFFQERIVTVPEVVNRIQIQRVQVPRIVQVEKIVQKVVVVNNIVEVQKPVVHYVKDYQIVKSVVEKIIPIPKIVERIKEVKVHVEKLIEKMVEIPKVVEIQKVVQKIVVVPRIIQKVIEVPQIIQHVVDRIVEVQKIIQIEKQVQVPIFTQKFVEVQVVKNVYVQIQKVVDRIVQKIVPVETIVQKIVEINNEIEKVVVINNQVPRPIEVEKVVSTTFEVEKVFEIQKPVTIPIQVPVQVQKIVEKVVVVEKNNQKLVQVPQLIQKIIEVNSETVQIEVVQKIVQRIIPKNVINTVSVDNVVVQNLTKEVPQIIEKFVPVVEVVNKIVEVEKLVQKVIQKVVEIPKIIEIEKIVQKIVRVPEIHTLQKIVPQLIQVNNIVETFIEKVISIPFREEVIKTIETVSQKIVPVKETDNRVTAVEIFRDKIVEIQKLVEIAQTQNFITKQVEVIERFEQKEIPVYSTIQKVIQVPHILEKIVQKIVILPQVVQILKNVHQIAETIPVGIDIPSDVLAQETQYRTLSSNLRKSLDQVLGEMRKLKNQQPSMKQSIEVIERMLVDLEVAVNFSRVVAVPKEVIVREEVSRPVLVHDVNIDNSHTLALSLLTEKLVQELRRLKNQRSDLKFKLDEDVSLIFFPQIGTANTTGLVFENQLRSYTESVLGKFRSLGGWKTDHELLLLNTLQQRFTHAQLLKDLNQEIKKARKATEDAVNENKQLKLANSTINQGIKKLEIPLNKFIDQARNDRNYNDVVREVSRLLQELVSLTNRHLTSYKTEFIVSPIPISGIVSDSVLQSQLRQAIETNEILKTQITTHQFGPEQELTLRSQNARLRDEITRLRSHNLNNQQYERLISDLKSQLTTFSSSRVTLYSEEQIRADYEKKLKDQAISYEKLIVGLKSGENSLTNMAIQFVDRLPQPYESKKGSNQNTSRLESSQRLQRSQRLQSSQRLESSQRLLQSSQRLQNSSRFENRLQQSQRSSTSSSKPLSAQNIHAIGHANVVPQYYYLPGQQPSFKS